MKKLFITLCLACIAMTASAQKMPTENLNETQARFYEGCTYLREGSVKKSASRLKRAATLLDNSENNDNRIVLAELKVTFDDEHADSVSMNGHMYFSEGYATYLSENIGGTYKEKPYSLRAGERGECLISQSAIKAHGKIWYHTPMADLCQIYAIAEPGGKIKFSVKDTGNGVVYDGTPYDDGEVSYVEWTQSKLSQDAIIMIENTSDSDFSFVIAVNW